MRIAARTTCLPTVVDCGPPKPQKEKSQRRGTARGLPISGSPLLSSSPPVTALCLLLPSLLQPPAHSPTRDALLAHPTQPPSKIILQLLYFLESVCLLLENVHSKTERTLFRSSFLHCTQNHARCMIRTEKTTTPLWVYPDSPWSSEAAWNQDSPTHFSITHSRMFHEWSRGCPGSVASAPTSARLAVGSSRTSAVSYFPPWHIVIASV